MHRLLLASVTVLLIAGALGAQVWTDDFSYQPGTQVGSWVEHLKDWTATGTQAQAQPVTNYGHMTQPKLTFQDCVADVEVEYNSQNGGLQFAGVILRANGPSQGSFGYDLLLIKAQGSSNFNRAYLYEHSQTGSLSAVSVAITAFTKGRVRLAVIDSRLVARIDTNNDGKFDTTITKNVSLPVKSGPVGVCGYNGSFVDNYRLYDAVILDDAATPAPKPGNEYKMVLRGFPGATYQAATALSNAGIPIGGGRVIPLGVDSMLFASATNVLPTLFKNYLGNLDGKGDGAISIALPNLPALTGVTLYTAFVNFKGSTILTTSNDHQVTIQ